MKSEVVIIFYVSTGRFVYKSYCNLVVVNLDLVTDPKSLGPASVRPAICPPRT